MHKRSSLTALAWFPQELRAALAGTIVVTSAGSTSCHDQADGCRNVHLTVSRAKDDNAAEETRAHSVLSDTKRLADAVT